VTCALGPDSSIVHFSTSLSATFFYEKLRETEEMRELKMLTYIRS
jgi:hypothetical protein